MMTAGSPPQPSPFTPLTREEELRLWPLAVHARHLLQNLRYVDYRQAQADAALLAQKIRQLYTPAELQNAAFTALPRGGLIVLGLLAYQLDLKPQQLTARFAREAGLLFLVDDCALSGKRLQEALVIYNGRPLVVAHLYAAPGLRAAIQETYPHVRHCLAAHDLAEAEGSAPLDGRLHPGPSDLVAFAWNEPDLLLQTPFDDQPAHQWRLLPPHKCLNNRQALGLPPAPPADRDWIVPEGIVYGWFDGLLYLLDTRNEQVHRLDNFAADCWRAAAGYGSQEIALAFLQEKYAAVQVRNLAAVLHHFKAKHLIEASPPTRP